MSTLLAPPPVREPRPGVVPFTAVVDLDGSVVLDGELDSYGIDALQAVLEQAYLEPGDIVVDAAGLSFIDPRALSELLRFQVLAAAQQRELRLARISPAVAEAVDRFDLRHLLAPPIAR